MLDAIHQRVSDAFDCWEKRSTDKKKVSMSFIYGMSGVGKTRLCMQLLAQLQRRSTGHLSECLSSSRLVLIDVRHNGERYRPEIEKGLLAGTSLALRIAHNLWCPHVTFANVLDYALMSGVNHANRVFTLHAVFAAAASEMRYVFFLSNIYLEFYYYFFF